jgi:hypothetical protein
LLIVKDSPPLMDDLRVLLVNKDMGSSEGEEFEGGFAVGGYSFWITQSPQFRALGETSLISQDLTFTPMHTMANTRVSIHDLASQIGRHSVGGTDLCSQACGDQTKFHLWMADIEYLI